MPIVRIENIDDARVGDYRNVSDAELLRRRGLFVAEGRLVVARMLSCGRYPARSLLVTDTALAALGAAVPPDVPVYVCDLQAMREIVGFNIHRGCLALGVRRPPAARDHLLAASRLVLVLEAIRDADNVGSIFRNAAALGGDAILLSPGCCDPLYRKSIRTSMGGALSLPYGWLSEWPEDLDAMAEHGFVRVALTPSPGGTSIEMMAPAEKRLALVLGNEREGLTAGALARTDHLVRIPMRPDVDSVNVATAAAIALHRLAHGRI